MYRTDRAESETAYVGMTSVTASLAVVYWRQNSSSSSGCLATPLASVYSAARLIAQALGIVPSSLCLWVGWFCWTAVILSNSVPIYLSIHVRLSADFRLCKRLQWPDNRLPQGVTYLPIAYGQTADVRNIFRGALCVCGGSLMCLPVIIYLPDISVCV